MNYRLKIIKEVELVVPVNQGFSKQEIEDIIENCDIYNYDLCNWDLSYVLNEDHILIEIDED